MSLVRRVVLSCIAVLVAVSVVGCATTVQNTLQADQVASFKLAGVTVRYTDDAKVTWDDAVLAYGAEKGIPHLELAQVSDAPEVRAFARNMLAPRIKAAMERQLAPRLAGTRPVRLEITVHGFLIVSVFQRIVLGGGHTIVADAILVDARTGATLVAYPKLVAVVAAGQGVIGTAVQAAFDAGEGVQPADRLVNAYAEAYGLWLMKK